MCGRYVSAQSATDLQTLYHVTSPSDVDIPPSWNVAPTQQVYGVLERNEKDGPAVARQLRALRWGLVPSWAKDQKIGSRLINARVETLADKPSFRSAFAKRRAILPSNGYYEWQPIDVDGKARKQPYFLHPAQGECCHSRRYTSCGPIRRRTMTIRRDGFGQPTPQDPPARSMIELR